MSATPLLETELAAYADRQLAPDRAARVEAAIARDPALAARVGEIRAQNAALHDALDPQLSEPIPQRLLDAARYPAKGSSVFTRARASLAGIPRPLLATAASLVIGIAVGWFGRDAAIERTGTPTTFAREAAFAHALYAADARRPVEVWAAEEKSLATWLTRRMGFPVRAPDLSASGFSLVGGRLVAGNEKPTGLFMYENADKQRLTLQVRKQMGDPAETAFRYSVENGVGVFYWIDDGCGYAISGNIDRSQLLAVARAVYGQLGTPDSAK